MIGIRQTLVQRHFEILWDNFCKFCTVEIGYTIWLGSGLPPWEYLSTALRSPLFHERYSTFQIKSGFFRENFGSLFPLAFLLPGANSLSHCSGHWWAGSLWSSWLTYPGVESLPFQVSWGEGCLTCGTASIPWVGARWRNPRLLSHTHQEFSLFDSSWRWEMLVSCPS